MSVWPNGYRCLGLCDGEWREIEWSGDAKEDYWEFTSSGVDARPTELFHFPEIAALRERVATLEREISHLEAMEDTRFYAESERRD